MVSFTALAGRPGWVHDVGVGHRLFFVRRAGRRALVGVDEGDVIAAVTAEFGSCEKVTARPLTPDPATGKRGQATGRKGLRYAALREWVGATARATS